MKVPLQLLVIEDSELDAQLIAGVPQRQGFCPRMRRVQTECELKEALDAQRWDAVISDLHCDNTQESRL
ncbi:MAG: hybrid sensor histidine kinase/response regulator [Verrucomicrobiales bacterium]|nr:hybrid sensor histidine kinase/response regulator [Verrucomicrobiales bacterium]